MPDSYSSPRWQRFRLEILERDGYQCQIRGPKCKRKANEVDHIVPLADGGPMFDPGNCRAACNWCNTWRAQRQKSREGWKRAGTHIVLVMGPPAAGKTTYVRQHAEPGDVVIDYDAIAQALGPGGANHELVMQLRGKLLTQLRRGELDVARAWILTCDPAAERRYPHHDVVVLDPGQDEVLRRVERERSPHLRRVVLNWYKARAGHEAEPAGMREW